MTRLPPLNAVRAFEVSARHLNFARAAEALGVTQGAISKQVIALEDFIGAKLFERLPGGLALTEEGKSVMAHVGPAFAALEDGFTRFARRPPRSNVFRLSTIGSFAAETIVPNLHSFRERFPDMELELLTSDRLVDLAREEVDLSVRFGKGPWDGLVSRPVNDGRLIPVCAPSLAVDGAALVSGHPAPRIQIFSADEWRIWSDASGIEIDRSGRMMIVEDFLVALNCALLGEGLALLPEPLTRRYLADGRLVRFSDVDAIFYMTYQLAYPPNSDRKPKVRGVMDWICEIFE